MFTRSKHLGYNRLFLTLLLSSLLLIPVSCHDEINSRLDALQGQIDALKSAQAALENRLYITSVLKNDNGYMISFSDGTSALIQSNIAVSGGEEYIKSIQIGELAVTFYLSNGEQFEIPLYAALSFTIDDTVPIIAEAGGVIEVSYSVTSRLTPVNIDVVSSSDIQARVISEANKLQIKFLKEVDEFSKVMVFVSNGEKIVIRTLTFENAQMQVSPSDVMHFESEGGTQDISIITNLGFQVSIPETDMDWIRYTETRTLMEYNGIISVSANESYDDRESILTVFGNGTTIKAQIHVIQSARTGFQLRSNKLTVLREGGVFEIPIQANADCSFSIPSSASSWIIQSETRGLTEHSAFLAISENSDDKYRTAELRLSCGTQSTAYYVRQFGASSSLAVEHSNKSFGAPSLEASTLPELIVVDWGDGTNDDYSTNLSHTYDANGTYIVTVTCSSDYFPYFSIPSLTGITGLNFSDL